VIIDEVHLIYDANRGHVLDTALSILQKENIPFVCMTGTLHADSAALLSTHYKMRLAETPADRQYPLIHVRAPTEIAYKRLRSAAVRTVIEHYIPEPDGVAIFEPTRKAVETAFFAMVQLMDSDIKNGYLTLPTEVVRPDLPQEAIPDDFISLGRLSGEHRANELAQLQHLVSIGWLLGIVMYYRGIHEGYSTVILGELVKHAADTHLRVIFATTIISTGVDIEWVSRLFIRTMVIFTDGSECSSFSAMCRTSQPESDKVQFPSMTGPLSCPGADRRHNHEESSF
jgi:Lhr-like helicase